MKGVAATKIQLLTKALLVSLIYSKYMPLLVPPRKERSVSAKESAIYNFTHSTRLP